MSDSATDTASQDISLVEYETQSLPRNALSEDTGVLLYKNYGAQVAVEFPSPKTDGMWELTSLGWVGYIPLPDGTGITLGPRVPLRNLFGMLEYAYDLKSFRFLEGFTDCESLSEFYEKLANWLAKLVRNRARKGLYRDYLNENNDLPYLRGKWDVLRMARRPWDHRIACEYQDHTADVEENQLLAWTLLTIIRSHLCTEALPSVRQAYRSLRGGVSVSPKTIRDCEAIGYNRLNEDYHPMHALCRFFLDRTGPTHTHGGREILPFLVNMAQLFEKFVAKWLAKHPPEGLVPRAQAPIVVGETGQRRWRIDLALNDAATGKTRYVIDTKYKVSDSPDDSDMHQIRSYADATHCREAILAYPRRLGHYMDVTKGTIRTRSVSFDLEDDLEAAGNRFVEQILKVDLTEV
jgi:5-methylcytosine-specific restriction enzyme subunit McrC